LISNLSKLINNCLFVLDNDQHQVDDVIAMDAHGSETNDSQSK